MMKEKNQIHENNSIFRELRPYYMSSISAIILGGLAIFKGLELQRNAERLPKPVPPKQYKDTKELFELLEKRAGLIYHDNFLDAQYYDRSIKEYTAFEQIMNDLDTYMEVNIYKKALSDYERINDSENELGNIYKAGGLFFVLAGGGGMAL